MKLIQSIAQFEESQQLDNYTFISMHTRDYSFHKLLNASQSILCIIYRLCQLLFLCVCWKYKTKRKNAHTHTHTHNDFFLSIYSIAVYENWHTSNAHCMQALIYTNIDDKFFCIINSIELNWLRIENYVERSETRNKREA